MALSGRLTQHILDLNATQSRRYIEETPLRLAYLRAHPTKIIVFKCMDSRLNLAVMAGLLFGILIAKRNIGGIFDVGWPALAQRLIQEMDEAWLNRNRCLFLVTYHWSASDDPEHPHLGCAGHNNDKDAAMASAAKTVMDLRFGFHGDIQRNYAILVGIETDGGSLVFHSEDGKSTISTADLIGVTDDVIAMIFRGMYPNMADDILRDLVPLIRGNIEYVKALTRHPKSDGEKMHREQLICLGTLFDWLHEIGLSLIVNDVDPEFRKAFAKGGSIVISNREAGRIPADEHAACMISVPYARDFERHSAILRARYLFEAGQEALRQALGPEFGFFQFLTGVMDKNTRLFEPIDTQKIMPVSG